MLFCGLCPEPCQYHPVGAMLGSTEYKQKSEAEFLIAVTRQSDSSDPSEWEVVCAEDGGLPHFRQPPPHFSVWFQRAASMCVKSSSHQAYQEPPGWFWWQRQHYQWQFPNPQARVLREQALWPGMDTNHAWARPDPAQAILRSWNWGPELPTATWPDWLWTWIHWTWKVTSF